MNVGEYGVLFQLSVGFNISGFTTLTLVITRPDGTSFTRTNPTVSAPAVDVMTTMGLFLANTYGQYTFQVGDLSLAGTYCAELTYDDATQHLISDVTHFTIDANAC